MLHKLTKNLTRHLTRCQLILKIDCEAKGLLFGDQKWKACDQICMACSSNKHFKISKIKTFLGVWKMWDSKTYFGKAQCIVNKKNKNWMFK
jgi:hypothetical protein